MALLALAMIVRDEASSIGRTLASVVDVVDVAVLIDTGSTDDTIGIARATCEASGLRLVVESAPFVDYSTTRNLALERAEREADHVLMLSGGERLQDAGELRAFLATAVPAPACYLRTRLGSAEYDSPRLSRSGAGCRYVGATHEVLVLPGGALPEARAPGIVVHEKAAGDGARDLQRWRRDIDLLRPGALQGEQRALFYLAQSYECIGNTKLALKWYSTRANAGGWREEAWEASFRRARLLTGAEQRSALLACWEAAPGRAEPLHALARICRAAGEYAQATLYARAATRVPYPTQVRLFVDVDVYRWSSWDVLAMSAWHVGEMADGLAAAEAAAAGWRSLRGTDDPRLVEHVRWYRSRLNGGDRLPP